MEFCEECGSMMKADGDVWVCGSCGHETRRDAGDEAWAETSQSQEETDVVDLSDVDPGDTGRPTTDARCPECGHDSAYWHMKQIRAADESETRFFVCTECGRKWREDDH
jgi:DNA-directed RNA polymerase subunit M